MTSSTTTSSTTKILFCASYQTQPIGYSRVANILSNALATYEDVKVYYFGFSNYPQVAQDRYVNENITMIDVLSEEGLVDGKENFGVNLIEKYLTTINPDIVFIYNDIIVTCRLINAIIEYKKKSYAHKFKLACYIDLVYKNERALYLNHLRRNADLVFVFSPSWKTHLVDLGFDSAKVKILPHGINKHVFKPEFPEDAREDLKFGHDDFIVLNTNRNTYRKMWDISIKAFLLFLKKQKCNSKIKLLVNCKIEDASGYRIKELILLYCRELELDESAVMNEHIVMLSTAGQATDETICLMYNASTIGLNTCCGEGFGLCNVEHAYFGAPQVVSSVGALKDIFSNDMSRVITPVLSIECPNLLDDHNGTLEICRAEDFAEAMSYYYENPEMIKQHGNTVKERVNRLFDWDVILDQFFKDLAPLFV